MQEINSQEFKNISSYANEIEYECLRCGYKIKLPKTTLTEIVGECPNCGRHTIFRRIEIEFDKSKYIQDGKFISRILAEDLIKKYSIITFVDTEEIYLYDDGIYTPAEARLKSIIEKILQEYANSYRVNETLNHIRRLTYVDRSKMMDGNPYFLCVKNGVIDLTRIKERETKLLPHTPDMIFLSKLPVEYKPNQDCPKIKKFLKEIVRPEDIPLLQEMVGYTLWKNYPIQKAFALLGEGNNGKSTFLRLLTKLLGKHNVSSISLQDLENNRFAAASLYGKLANIYADLPPEILRNTSKFKMLTGGDIITAEQKFKNPFEFYNYAKIIFSTNRLPISHDDTEAFFRRWILIDFPYKFEGDNRDPHILEKIATPEELSGFLNWALEGLARLLKNGEFSNAMTTEEIRRQYIMASDPIHAFVDECLIQDTEGMIPKELLYATFIEYCNNKKLPAVSKQVFSRDLPRFIAVSEQRPKIGKRQERCWAGIKLNDNGTKFIPSELIEKYKDILDKLATKSNISNISNFLHILRKNLENNNKIKKNKDILDKVATILLDLIPEEPQSITIYELMKKLEIPPLHEDSKEVLIEVLKSLAEDDKIIILDDAFSKFSKPRSDEK